MDTWRRQVDGHFPRSKYMINLKTHINSGVNSQVRIMPMFTELLSWKINRWWMQTQCQRSSDLTTLFSLWSGDYRSDHLTIRPQVISKHPCTVPTPIVQSCCILSACGCNHRGITGNKTRSHCYRDHRKMAAFAYQNLRILHYNRRHVIGDLRRPSSA